MDTEPKNEGTDVAMASRPGSGKPLLSEGIALAVATLAGYAVAFAHEAGYANHFSVPLDVISVDITTILVAMAALFGLGWFLFIVFNPLSSIFMAMRLPAPLRERLVYLVLPAVFLAAHFYVFGTSAQWTLVAPLLGLLVLVSSVEFLLPLVTQRRVPGYLAKLEAQNADDFRPRRLPSPILGPVYRAVGRQGIQLMLSLGCAIYMALWIGQAAATKREWFLCPVDSPDIVVVRTYGSAVVGAKYDPRSHRLVGEVLLGSRGEGRWADLKLRRVGPLTRSPSSP